MAKLALVVALLLCVVGVISSFKIHGGNKPLITRFLKSFRHFSTVDESQHQPETIGEQKPYENRKSTSKFNNQDKISSLYLGNIPKTSTQKEVEDALIEKLGGKVFERLQIVPKEGAEQLFAFMYFSDKEKMNAAFAGTKGGIEFQGSVLKVNRSRVKTESRKPYVRKVPDEDNQRRTVYVGNIDFSITQEQLDEMCDDVLGKNFTKSVRLGRDRVTNLSRGFAHIDCHSDEDALKVIEELKGILLMGRSLIVNLVSEKSTILTRKEYKLKNAAKSSLYLGNLPFGASFDNLQEMLTAVLGKDTVTDIRIQYDRETNKSKGFAYVDLASDELLERGMAELNGIEFLGRPLRVDIAHYKPPNARNPRD